MVIRKLFRISIFGFRIFLFFTLISFAFATEELPWPQIKFEPEDRILILAPHPDDEAIACAGIIQQARAKNLPLRLVFLTHGDTNQWSFLVYRKHPVIMPEAVKKMGLVRHEEAVACAAVFGVPAEQLIFLGYPDFGTLTMWYRHWDARPAFKSIMTKARGVPYANALRPGAPYRADEILKDLKSILREFRPTKIFVSHPADHNLDHRALYLFTRVAVWDLEDEISPRLYPYPVHFKKWPLPRGYYPEARLVPPPQLDKAQIPWVICRLSQEEIETKFAALKTHGTQFKSSGGYLSSFARQAELFGDPQVVKLISSHSAVSLASEPSVDEAFESQEELTDRQKAGLAGIEERYVQLKGGNLVFTLEFSRPLGEGIGISVYLFGYRKDKPFEKMPKLHVKLGVIKYEVLDQASRLAARSIRIRRKPREIILTVPLEVLGNPERILTTANSYAAPFPLDWTSWQILELPHE